MNKKYVLSLVLISFATIAIAQNQSESLWEDNKGNSFGLSIGYVSKEWVTDFNDGTGKVHEDLFGCQDKRLHGVQIGLTFKPVSRYGFGGYTGLFGEAYFASGRDFGYDNFTESSLYVPFHALFQIPVSEDVALTLQGGVGLNYVLSGDFSNHNDYYYDEWGNRHNYTRENLRYGTYGWPKRFNCALEAGIGVKINMVNIKVFYSYGLTDHHLYTDHPRSKTYQHKLGVSVSFEMDDL